MVLEMLQDEKLNDKIIYGTAKVYDRSYIKKDGTIKKSYQKNISIPKDAAITDNDKVIIIKTDDVDIENLLSKINNDDDIAVKDDKINELQKELDDLSEKENELKDKIILLENEKNNLNKEITDLVKNHKIETDSLNRKIINLSDELHDHILINTKLVTDVNNSYDLLKSNIKDKVNAASFIKWLLHKDEIKESIDNVIDNLKISIPEKLITDSSIRKELE